MAPEQYNKLLTYAQESVTNIQKQEISNLDRVTELGTQLHFREAIQHATRVLKLFNQIRVESLGALPPSRLQAISNACKDVSTTFDRVRSFNSATQGNPATAREEVLESVRGLYDRVFEHVALAGR